MKNINFFLTVSLMLFALTGFGAIQTEQCPATPDESGWTEFFCLGKKGTFQGAAITHRDQYYITCYFNNSDKTQLCSIEKGSKNKITPPESGSLWTQTDPLALYTCKSASQANCKFNINPSPN